MSGRSAQNIDVRAASWIVLLALITASSAFAAADLVDERFNVALRQIDTNHIEDAIPTLDALYKETKAPRIRLELARAYFLDGQLDKARDLFIAAYEDNPPPAVKATILNFLNLIALREGKITFGVSLTKVTNPLNQPSAFGINFGGTYLELVQNTAAKNLTGVLFSGSYEQQFADGFSIKTSDTYRYMRIGSADMATSDTYVAKDITKANIEARAGLELVQMTGQSYLLSYAEALYDYDIATNWSALPTLQVGYFASEVSPSFSGMNVRFGLPFKHALDPAMIFAIGPNVEFHDSESSILRYDSYGFTVDTNLKFNYVNIDASVMPRITEFAAGDPFWGVTRRDKGLFGFIDISSDYIRYGGFLPTINAYCNSNGSDVKLYTLNGCGFSVGVNRLF